MAKKAKKVKYKGPTLLDRLPNNHGEWLLLCIKFTERVIANPPRESDQQMINQAARLKAELEEWKKANKGETLRNL